MRRALINKCALVETKDSHGWGQGSAARWAVDPHFYDFYYYNRKIATVEFSSYTKVYINKTYSPWSLVTNADETHVLCRFNRVEDEFHGVDLIDEQVLIALYLEKQVNDSLKEVQIPKDEDWSTSAWKKILEGEIKAATKTFDFSGLIKPLPQPKAPQKPKDQSGYWISTYPQWDTYKSTVKITGITPEKVKSAKKRRK